MLAPSINRTWSASTIGLIGGGVRLTRRPRAAMRRLRHLCSDDAVTRCAASTMPVREVLGRHERVLALSTAVVPKDAQRRPRSRESDSFGLGDRKLLGRSRAQALTVLGRLDAKRRK